MDRNEAVLLAKQGKEEGFGYLFQNIYKGKYYLALKYLRNENLAQNALSDAYIKAFSSLNKL